MRVIFRRVRAAAMLRLRRVALLLAGIASLSFLSTTFFTPAVQAQADLTMTQATSISVVDRGINFNYTEIAINNGPNPVPAGTLVVYQQTPPNTTLQSITLIPTTNWACPNPGATGPIICTYALALASGASTAADPIVFTLSVNGGTAYGTTILNSATVTSQTTDTVPSNNTSVTSVLVEPASQADMAISMTAAPTPVFLFSTLTYTIQVQNLGQLNAATVQVVDTIPAGTTFVSANAPAGWTCAGTATVTCSLTGTMAQGTSATITITVTTPSTAGPITNTATVSSTTPDPVATNNSATVITVVQPLVCATPGKNGAGGILSGMVNAYYPPSGNGALAAGATTVTLGASSGAVTPIVAGDLLLIIDMQDALINATNTGAYGDGTPGDPATGSTNLQSSGQFEFVTATNGVPVGGGALNFQGTGAGGGTLNTYVQAAYAAGAGGHGQQRYQVIRVPQYTSATLSSGLVPLAWNGSVGGVLAIDVASQLTLGGIVSANALGFRGGGGRILAGGAGANTDYVTVATINADASKGEGIAGTPHYLAPATILTTTVPTNTASEGLPNGSNSRGAPGNAGGGGTDGNPVANDENSGGGAGGNGGAGGLGGYGWNTFTVLNSTDGGFGGAAFAATTSSLVLGGGGGAGTTNNGSYFNSAADHNNNCGAACTGIYSSGGAGGGIIIVHTGSVSGSGTITSNGQSTLSTDNDSTGGAGAGGSILFFANSGSLGSLTVSAIGGNGGNAWPEQAPTAFSGNRHGPGGGGGGGVIFLSATPAPASSVNGGNNGYTNTSQDSYGATPGQPGILQTTHVITETPGTQPGAYCSSADLAVTNSAAPVVVVPGTNITYTQGVNNNGPFDAVNAVFTETTPANTTFQSINTGAAPGWTCATPPVNGSGTITCSNPDFASGGAGTFIIAVQVISGTTGGTQIIDVDSVNSGTSDPNLANNTAIVATTVGTATQANLVVANTASAPTVTVGSNVTMTAAVTNNGPSAASTAVFTETIPPNTTLGAAFTAPAGWLCNTIAVGGTGTFTCTQNSFAALTTSTFTIVLNVNSGTVSGTVISDTANISSATPDPNYANNSSTATTIVGAAGQADLAVSSSGIPNPVLAGNNITYTQSVTNNGPSVITIASGATVTFTDAIPANTTLGALLVPPANWTCNVIAVGSTGTFTCTLNSGQTLAIGAIVNFPMVVKVNATTAPGTTITNSPSIGSSVTDPYPPNNSATVATLVASPTQADLTISKIASPEPVNQNTNLSYTIIVKNAGPAAAQNVTVTDPIPAQVTYSSSITSVGNCTYAAPNVICNLNTLSVGSAAVITINATANTFSASAVPCPGYPNSAYPGGVGSCNTATVTTTTSNVNPNNSASVGSTIQAPTAVDVSSFNAFSQPDGSVRLVWRTHEESRNLGFHVYREDSSGRHRIDAALIAGSALLLRGSRPQHAAKLYGAIDSQPAPNAAYWIEDVDINGTRTLHGPAYAQFSSSGQPQPQAQAQTGEVLKVSPSLAQFHADASLTTSAMRPVRTPRPIFPAPPAGVPRFNVLDHVAVQISVDHEGWYHIPFSQLFSVGLSPNSDLRSLRLYAEGIEQPLLLVGHSSGMASPADAIEFYGSGIDTPFSAARVYWLTTEGSYAKRILPVPASSSGTVAAASFPFTVIREERSTYFAALLNGENNDNFFGDVITSDPVDEVLTVAHRDTSSSQSLTLDLSLQGVTDAQQHTISVQLNGSTVGTFEFFGEILAKQSFAVDPSQILDGVNTITLTALNGDNDVSVVQSIELHYPHTYSADADWLRAAALSGSDVHVSGFADSQVRAFDITDPLNISELTGKITLESGFYSITVTLPAGAPAVRTILAFSPDALSSPPALKYHAPTHLDDRRAGADIIILTHPDFASHLTPLVRLRESQGYHVALVTTDQVFDQFNNGERSPFAIRSFLQDAAAHWQRKPQALLLVGDASMDPRNYLGFGDFDFVPTRIVETAAFKTASDDWLTDFQQNGFATIPTGRLPVRTTADVDLLVAKIVSYEQGEFASSWNTQALLIADQNIDSNFTSAVTSAAGTLPASLQTTQLLTDGVDPATVRSQVLAALNSGALLVNYNGHGAEQQWSFSDIFNNTDASALTNGGRLPVYVLIDCLNGLFQDVYAQSLAEALILAPNGGAVAVWASSGFTEQSPQESMNLAFLHQLATHPRDPVGRMILNAKASTTDSDVRRTWNLFGDPAMRFHFATSISAPVSDPLPAPHIPKEFPHGCLREPACPKEIQ
ncbi:MAG: C25 family cysteine peptidase [Candidatus Acidiferrum sp.]